MPAILRPLLGRGWGRAVTLLFPLSPGGPAPTSKPETRCCTIDLPCLFIVRAFLFRRPQRGPRWLSGFSPSHSP